jgi:hypothetical protein
MSKAVMLNLIGKWFVGDAFPLLKKTVIELETDNTLTGVQKKAKVIEVLKEIGISLAGHLLDLGIALARTAILAAI